MKPRCPEVLRIKKRSSPCGLCWVLANNFSSLIPGHNTSRLETQNLDQFSFQSVPGDISIGF